MVGSRHPLLIMLYWITLPLALVSLAIFYVTLGRHWKEIRLLDPDSIKEERVRRKREEIISQRFERVKSSKLAPLKVMAQRVIMAGKKSFHAAYIKLIQLDRFYKQAKAPFAHAAPPTRDRIRALLEEARSLARDLKWADAERRFLEILALDERHADAYKGLAGIYLKQKLYPQAKETFEFLAKIDRADAFCHEGLGEIAEAEEDARTAEQMYLKALELQPRLARRHARLAEFYLRQEDPGKAWPPAKRATDLEQKSVKYLDLAIEAALRLKHRDDARRLYDRLRLVSEDRSRLQSISERIQEI